MNFDHMPELGWPLGYPMAIGLMLAMGIVLYACSSAAVALTGKPDAGLRSSCHLQQTSRKVSAPS